ncbi:MAG TPA: cell division protein ZipA [Pseudomonas xinjiangensis]|uniref:Cell division protein ZipA n=2 Tax=root TaxID=1 RepID=A0A7V1BRE6_9GAMM|nr:cell division protein ZipA [Halopseudomonas xinjiangensis]HEC47503.1 cell division protein ZipA [Halopseudomonas xinjiangensis]
MDFGLREWLIIIGLLVIAGILFDGWRRMGGRSKIRFKLERNLKDQVDGEPKDDLLGPPRVIGRPDRSEPSFGDEFETPPASRGEAARREPEQVGLDLGSGAEPLGETRAPKPRKPPPKPLEPRERAMPKQSGSPKESGESAPLVASEPSGRTEPGFKEEPAAPREAAPVEEVFIINVVARDELGFQGSALVQNILESGLRFGEMNIFHRHESMSGNGDVLFSMANALKPGVFDLDEMDSSHVRAVSFFMGLPGPRHPKQALDLMIAAARKLAHELGGDLKDEQRSVLTAQTIEHYRQRIAEFERKHYNLRR